MRTARPLAALAAIALALTAAAQTQPPDIPVSALDLNGDGKIDCWEMAAMGAPPQANGQPAPAVPAGVPAFVNRWNWAAEHPLTPPPPPATGACCTPAGACSVTTQAACSGSWAGAGTTCTPNPCPQPPPTNGPTWTDLTPPPGSVVHYVSSSTGSDNNNGTSANAPYKTIAKAMAAARDGSADQILLKAGDTFAGPVQLTKTGASATARLVIGSYGTGPRPVITAANGGNGFDRACGGSRGNLVIADLEVRAATGSEYNGGPGSGCGISWFCGPAFSGKNILIENCKFTRLFRGMEIQDAENLVVRFNAFEDICSRTGAGYSPQAIYVGLTRNITIEDNNVATRAFTTVRAPYQQDTNIYVQDENEGTISIRRNIITSKGTQGPLGLASRSNATIADNFIEGCHTGIHVGGQDTPPSGKYPNGTHYTVQGNVVTRLVNMTNQAGGERGIGIQYAYFDTAGTLIADNIISNKTVSTDGTGLNSDPAGYGPTRNATITRNVLYNANGIQFQGSGSSGNTIEANLVQNPSSASSENALVNPFATSVGTWRNNTYHSVRAAGTWFQVNYANRTNAQWLATEPSAVFQAYSFPNPTRSLTGYASSIGAGNTWEDAATALMAQSKTNYDARWSAGALLGYFRAGFGLAPTP